jgi:hypothetical protein
MPLTAANARRLFGASLSRIKRQRLPRPWHFDRFLPR